MSDDTSKCQKSLPKSAILFLCLGGVFLLFVADLFLGLLADNGNGPIAPMGLGFLSTILAPICFCVSFFLGHGWKGKLPGCLLGIFSLIFSLLFIVCGGFALYWMWSMETLPSRFPFEEISPDKQTTAILECDERKCFVVRLDEQVFHTWASIYQNAKWEWEGNDLFRLDSSDVGIFEFRRVENGWEGEPREMIREYDKEAKNSIGPEDIPELPESEGQSSAVQDEILDE